MEKIERITTINRVAPSISSRERNNPTPLSTKQKVNNTFSNFLINFLLLFLKNMVIHIHMRTSFTIFLLIVILYEVLFFVQSK